MKNDLISREALKEALYDFLSENSTNCDWEDIFNVIDNAPTVDISKEVWNMSNELLNKRLSYLERPQGEWLFHRCSLCGKYDARDNENFCSNCGADMRKGGAE